MPPPPPGSWNATSSGAASQQRFQSANRRRATFHDVQRFLRRIDISAELVAAVEYYRREYLVRGGAAVLPNGPRGGVPAFFTGSLDEWVRVEAVLPFFQMVVSTHGLQSEGEGIVRFGIENISHRQFDIVVGPHKGGAHVVCFSHLLKEGPRRLTHDRLRSLRPATATTSSRGGGGAEVASFVSCCVVLVDVEEPQLDILTWINLTCAEEEVVLQLCWTWSEAMALMEGLGEGGGEPPERRSSIAGNGSSSSSVQIMIGALSQTPALMSRQDVIRASNKVSSVAELLLQTEHALSGLPGIGARKAKRIQGVFHAPFPTTEARLDDIWLESAAAEDSHPPTTKVDAQSLTLECSTKSAPLFSHAFVVNSRSHVKDSRHGSEEKTTSVSLAATTTGARRLPNASVGFKAALDDMLRRELEDGED